MVFCFFFLPNQDKPFSSGSCQAVPPQDLRLPAQRRSLGQRQMVTRRYLPVLTATTNTPACSRSSAGTSTQLQKSLSGGGLEELSIF